MATLPGIAILGNFVPTDDLDLYPITESTYNKGGWHEVATTDLRDEIPLARRTEGMAVYVTDDGSDSGPWILLGGIENVNWSKLSNLLPPAFISRDVTFVLRGKLTDTGTPGVGVTNPVTVDGAGVIDAARVVMSVAPRGSEVEFAIMCNNTDITTGPNRLKVSPAEYSGATYTFSTNTFTNPSTFSLEITKVGSIDPGAWAIVTLSIRINT